MKSFPRLRLTLPSLLIAGILTAQAHPIPDIPVRSEFKADGAAIVKVEVDPRAFEADPLTEPYLQFWVLREMSDEERADLLESAEALVRDTIAFYFDPGKRIIPTFSFEFAKLGGGPLKEIDDSVVLIGKWKTDRPGTASGYRISALAAGKLSVLFLNRVNGKDLERMQVLFPGEESKVLDLASATLRAQPSTSATTER